MGTSGPQFIYELHIIHLSAEKIEMTSAVLNFLEIQALEEKEDSIILYHDNAAYLENIEIQLLDRAPWLSNSNFKRDRRQNENWNKKWEASFEPIIVDDYCTIKASFHELIPRTKHVITIDPEMAFGTGHHETTYAMIEMMSTLNFQNKAVLDYGSGTGILAILAELEGAQSIVAIDYDEIATECAVKCIELNKCKNISCVMGELVSIDDNSKFEIILANINRNVLLENAEQLALRQNPNGILLLSGIMIIDRDIVIEKFKSVGYQLDNGIERGEWLCLKMKMI